MKRTATVMVMVMITLLALASSVHAQVSTEEEIDIDTLLRLQRLEQQATEALFGLTCVWVWLVCAEGVAWLASEKGYGGF